MRQAGETEQATLKKRDDAEREGVLARGAAEGTAAEVVQEAPDELKKQFQRSGRTKGCWIPSTYAPARVSW